MKKEKKRKENCAKHETLLEVKGRQRLGIKRSVRYADVSPGSQRYAAWRACIVHGGNFILIPSTLYRSASELHDAARELISF